MEGGVGEHKQQLQPQPPAAQPASGSAGCWKDSTHASFSPLCPSAWVAEQKVQLHGCLGFICIWFQLLVTLTAENFRVYIIHLFSVPVVPYFTYGWAI